MGDARPNLGKRRTLTRFRLCSRARRPPSDSDGVRKFLPSSARPAFFPFLGCGVGPFPPECPELDTIPCRSGEIEGDWGPQPKGVAWEMRAYRGPPVGPAPILAPWAAGDIESAPSFRPTPESACPVYSRPAPTVPISPIISANVSFRLGRCSFPSGPGSWGVKVDGETRKDGGYPGRNAKPAGRGF